MGFTIGFTNLPAAGVITTIVIQAFLTIMLGQFLGRKARAGNLRVSAEQRPLPPVQPGQDRDLGPRHLRRPAVRLGRLRGRARRQVIPYPYASTTSLNTPAFEQGMSFLTSTLTNEHLIAPGAETGPNANGDNLQTLFTQGKIAMWQAGDWNTTSLKTTVKFPVGVTKLPIGPDGRVSVFNGLIDGLNSHTKYPKQAWTRCSSSTGPSRASTCRRS